MTSRGRLMYQLACKKITKKGDFQVKKIISNGNIGVVHNMESEIDNNNTQSTNAMIVSDVEGDNGADEFEADVVRRSKNEHTPSKTNMMLSGAMVEYEEAEEFEDVVHNMESEVGNTSSTNPMVVIHVECHTHKVANADEVRRSKDEHTPSKITMMSSGAVVEYEEAEEFEDFVDSGSEYIPETESSDSEILSPNYSPLKKNTERLEGTELSTSNNDQESFSNSELPVSHKRKKTEIKRGPGRKRKPQVKQWRIKQIKGAYNSGIEHVNLKGKTIPARAMGPGCDSKCRMNCQSNVSSEYRAELFKEFWKLGNIDTQRQYILRHVRSSTKQTTKLIKKYERVGNKLYFIPKSNCPNEELRVCKKMFMDCFGINRQWIVTIFKKTVNGALELDKRGKFVRTISERKSETHESVKEHINSFPRIESHYLRKDSKREYLVADLNITSMHRLYLKWVSQERPSILSASKRQYYDIFTNEFNISFFIPKKDRCNDCTIFENAEMNRSEGDFAAHLNEAKCSRELKIIDKTIALESNGNILGVIFDFQKVLTCPNADVSTFYYKRNFNCYNFTVYCLNTRTAYCFVWDESVAKRGPNEVISCLKKFIEFEMLKNQNIKEIRFWSDNCFHQNKNKFLIAFYAWAANKYKINICQRYLTKGHTQNEADSVHATIENRKKHRDVMVPSQWYEIIKFAKINEPFYKVVEMGQNDFLNFKPLCDIATFKNEDFLISKLKELLFSKDSLVVHFKTNWSESSKFVVLVVDGKKRGRKAKRTPESFLNFQPTVCYDKPIPISFLKWQDLNYLCDSNLIQSEYHNFYSNLPYVMVIANDNEDCSGED